MAKFCGQCGAPAGEQRFCGSCGAPLAAAPTPYPASDETAIRAPLEDDGRTATRPLRAPAQQPAQQPAHPQAPAQQPWPLPGAPTAYPAAQPQVQVPPQQSQHWGAVPPGHQPPPMQQVQAAPMQPRAPRAVPLVNPFVGVPVSDFVKDAAAALALIVALTQPWDWSGDANDRWWAVVSILLALVGLGVPYLMASRVVPTFTPRASLVTKFALVVPILVSTLVALVMDLLTIGDESPLLLGDSGSEGGMGLGIALALGGATLVAQPRRYEEVTGLLAERAWRTAAKAAAVAALAVAVLTFVASAITIAADDYPVGAQFWVVMIMGNLVLPTVFLLVPLVALLRGSAGGRRTFAVIAWGVLVVSLVAEPDFGAAVMGSKVEGWSGPAGGLWLLGLAGGLLLSRPSVRGTHTDEVGGWLGTARIALVTTAAVTLGAAVLTLVTMALLETFPGWLVAAALMYLGVAVATGVAASMADNLTHRVTVSLATGLAIVLGVVMWVVVANSSDWISSQSFSVRDVVILFVLPGLALYSLWVPAAIRAQLPRQAPAAAWGQAPAPAGWGPQSPPGQGH